MVFSGFNFRMKRDPPFNLFFLFYFQFLTAGHLTKFVFVFSSWPGARLSAYTIFDCFLLGGHCIWRLGSREGYGLQTLDGLHWDSNPGPSACKSGVVSITLRVALPLGTYLKKRKKAQDQEYGRATFPLVFSFITRQIFIFSIFVEIIPNSFFSFCFFCEYFQTVPFSSTALELKASSFPHFRTIFADKLFIYIYVLFSSPQNTTGINLSYPLI